MRFRSRLLVLLMTVLLPWSAIAGALAPQCLRMQAENPMPAVSASAHAVMDEHCPHAMAMAAANAETSTGRGITTKLGDIGHAGCACPHACTAAGSLPSATLAIVLIRSERETLPLASTATPRAAIVARLLRPPAAA